MSTPPGFGFPRGVVAALAAVAAITLAWRVLVAGIDAYSERNGEISQPAAPVGAPGAESPWRERLVRNPADQRALLFLALEFEGQGKREEAAAALQQALRLAPGDIQTLQRAAAFFLRTGNERDALVHLGRAISAAPADVNTSIWDVLLEAFDAERQVAFFDDGARNDPAWWAGFFRLACVRATNLRALHALYRSRAGAGLATVDERRCVIERMQRDDQWKWARQVWLDGLPPGQRERAGLVFNGDFEAPLSNTGFDWLAPAQDGVDVGTEPTDGMSGQRALNITFVNKRFSGPPIYQYLMLNPGRYRFEGRGRTDLETWLGLQWGIYCRDASGREPRQLAYSDRFVGAVDWIDFRRDFDVPKDCPVQILRLELANPRRDANALGNVAVRLRGRLWFDDLRVRAVD